MPITTYTVLFKLTDITCPNISDETYECKTFLYTSNSGGRSIWKESKSPATVRLGKVKIILGEINPVYDLIIEHQILWLSIEFLTFPRKPKCKYRYRIIAPETPIPEETYADWAGRTPWADSSGEADNAKSSQSLKTNEIELEDHSFKSGEAVYLETNGLWNRASSNSKTTVGMGMIELDKDDPANKFKVVLAGGIQDIDNSICNGALETGSYYYVCDDNPGSIQKEETSISNPIFMATSPDSGIVLPHRALNQGVVPLAEHAEVSDRTNNIDLETVIHEDLIIPKAEHAISSDNAIDSDHTKLIDVNTQIDNNLRVPKATHAKVSDWTYLLSNETQYEHGVVVPDSVHATEADHAKNADYALESGHTKLIDERTHIGDLESVPKADISHSALSLRTEVISQDDSIFDQGDVVYLNSDGLWRKASTSDQPVGMIDLINTNMFRVVLAGNIKGVKPKNPPGSNPELRKGSYYSLHPDSSGRIVENPIRTEESIFLAITENNGIVLL